MTVMTNRFKTLAKIKLGESKVNHIIGRRLRLKYKTKTLTAARVKGTTASKQQQKW